MAEEPTKVPVYLQVQRFLEDLIDSADYGPGDHIPSERALADQLKVNRLTLRKAIDRLVSSGTAPMERGCPYQDCFGLIRPAASPGSFS